MEGVTGKANGSLVENGARKEDVNGQSSKEVMFGDLIWVKLHESSWWPAQVVDENFVSSTNKPSSKESSSDVLVRVYGSYIYKYVDVHRSHAEFKNVLMENNISQDEILKKTLEQDLKILYSIKPRRQQQSKSKAAVINGASQNKSSEKDVSNKSQTKVSRKKQKQDKTRTAEAHPATPHTKRIYKRLTPDGAPHHTEPSTPDTVTSRPVRKKVTLSAGDSSNRRRKVMQALGLVPPAGSPFPCNRVPGLVAPAGSPIPRDHVPGFVACDARVFSTDKSQNQCGWIDE